MTRAASGSPRPARPGGLVRHRLDSGRQARKVGDCIDPGQVWYSLDGGSMAELQQQWRGAAAGSDGPMIWTLLAFATTSLVIATAVALLFRLTGTTGLLPSVGLGLLLWISFCGSDPSWAR